MGLIRATLDAARNSLKDQWLEFVVCEDTSPDVLVKRGTIKSSGQNRGTEGVLTNGTRVAIPEGFAMLILDQGNISEFSAEAGEFIYESGTEPSIFYGELGHSLVNSIKQFGDRVRFAGDVPKDTRVYFINLREITGNKFGTSQPIPFDDPKYQTIDIRYFGMYSMKVTDPIILVRNLVGGNSKDEVRISEFLPQLKSEFITTLTTAMAKMAYEKNISFNRLPMYQEDLSVYMNDKLDDSWVSSRGLEIIQVALESVSVDDDAKEKIKEYDKMYFAEQHASGMMTAATAESMKAAAANEGGNAGMFMGMGVGGMMSGAMQAGSQMAYSTNNPAPTNMVATPNVEPVDTTPEVEPVSATTDWTCTCGALNTGKFCSDCGNKKVETTEWTCSCGNVNTGKFCSNCGNKKPESMEWTCTCGCKNTGKFCVNCGNGRP